MVVSKMLLAELAGLALAVTSVAASADEATTLNEIMQGLNSNLAEITDGLLSDDFELIARGAAGIAEHPRIPPEQVQLVVKELGEEMPAFKQFDTRVHDLSLEIRDAADSLDRNAVISGYRQLMDGCLACHGAYKERVATALAAYNTHSESDAVLVAAETNAAMSILTKEIVVQAPLDDVWHAWTTTDGLQYISGKSNVELRIGGPYEWFLDLEPDEHGKRGGQGSHVLAFLPQKMIAFSWTFPPSIPELRNADERTQVVVLFDEVSDGQVHVSLYAHGWQESEPWQRGWDYFDRAWGAVLNALKQHLE